MDQTYATEERARREDERVALRRDDVHKVLLDALLLLAALVQTCEQAAPFQASAGLQSQQSKTSDTNTSEILTQTILFLF